MDSFHITGFGEWDGEYDFDAGSFNIREWRWIRKLSDTTADTLVERYSDRDPDLLLAFAVIAMCREGKIERADGLRVAEEMAEIPLDGAKLRLVPEPVEVVPPLEESTKPPNGHLTKLQSVRLPPTGPLSTPSGKTSKDGSASSDDQQEATTGTRLVTSST